MRHIPFLLHEESDIHRALSVAKEEAKRMGGISTCLFTAFFVRFDEDFALHLEQAMYEAFPNGKFTGVLTEVAIQDSTLYVASQEAVTGDVRAVLSMFLFSHAQVQVLLPFQTGDQGRVAGTRLRLAIEATENVKAVGLLFTDLQLDYLPFFEEVSAIPQDIIVFGGWAGGEYPGGGSVLFLQGEMVAHGAAAFIMSGEELHAFQNESLAWRDLGHSFKVTRMEGPFRLMELDNQPAMDIFRHYLGLRRGWDSFQDILAFPVALERNGIRIARHLRDFLEDGSALLGFDLREGERITLAYGDPYAMIDDAARCHEETMAFQPEGVLTVSCIGRHFFLQENAQEELHLLARIAPAAGFYSYGEIRRARGKVMVTNMTLTTLALREGDISAQKRITPVVMETPPFHRQTAIIAHLVHFIEVITEEWREAHGKLIHLAERDSLTGLLNRRTMEKALEKGLNEAQSREVPLSVLMLDLDDFKSINDTYGHAMGDLALKETAQILRECTRIGTDLPSRWGGDEFFVVLQGAGSGTAQHVAERICANIRATAPFGDGRRLSASLGVVTARADDTPETIFHRADLALYAAKNAPEKGQISIG